MKVVICLKQIPDPDIIEFDLTNEKMKSELLILNPADFHALEEGLRIKDKYGGQVIVVSVAPKRGDDVLRKALIYGADRAIRAWDVLLIDADTWMISLILKQVIEEIGFDLVLCGNRSKSTSSEFMGVALSERLNVPVVTGVVGLELQGEKEGLAHKKLERGRRETYSFQLPAILTVDEGINEPRYVALFSRTYNEGICKKIEVIEPELGDFDLFPLIKLFHIGQPKPRTKVGKKVSGLSVSDLMKVLRGETGSKKELFSGSAMEGAQKIAAKLKEWYL
jgi:electron transfer flavoprotein beta subunit